MRDQGAPNDRPAELTAALQAERRHRREAEQKLRLLTEGVKDYAIVLMGPDGRITTWTEGAHALLGYREEEALGRQLAFILTDEDRRDGRPERELRTAREAGSADEEKWVVRKDGTHFWASGVITAVRDDAGGVRGFVKICRDLTERRAAEAALHDREARLRVALAAARMGTWDWDIPADRQELDEPLRELFGLPPGAGAFTLERFFGLVHPDDRAAVAEAFRRCAEEGVGLASEFRVVRPDGSVRWLRDQGDVVRDGRGRPARLTGACMDITDRKYLEQELRNANDTLERRVEGRAAELREAQGRALQAERLAAIGQVVTGLAHESRNALQRSQTCLERLGWKLDGQPEALALLAEVERAQDELVRLYEDVRGYAAPVQLDWQACDLGDVWRRAWARLEPQRRGRDARLYEEVGGCDLACEADPFRLEQVFRNILDNSLAACADPVVVVACAGADAGGRPGVRVSVRDNGPGLSAEQVAKIFEPFYTTKVKGTGLGMAIARRLVEAHGGQIALGPARAGAAPGAEVLLTLPRTRVGVVP